MLDESLSPLRRQLLNLVKMGILTVEEEANIKYYRLNKNFEGIDELRNLVLGNGYFSPESAAVAEPQAPEMPKRVKYDFVVLTLISIFVLATSIFVLYTSTSSVRKVAGLVSEKNITDVVSKGITRPVMPDEMTSKRWKVLPGNVPALSTGGIESAKNKEL
jgi:hypothetical protein